MYKIGFDNEKYLKMQSEHIRERIESFGGKLYLEFGGKLFDDFHASRVLPGFAPDSMRNCPRHRGIKPVEAERTWQESHSRINTLYG